MDRMPEPFWAICLAVLGVVVAIFALFKPDPENICLAVLAIASNLVSGALGAFAGHASATRQPQNPTPPVTPANT
jgi:membrane associated rhomboid family serine protease